MEEHASGTRIGVFPAHWRGIVPGQSTEQRAAAVAENVALDLEERGDPAQAANVRSSFACTRDAALLLERAQRIADGKPSTNPALVVRALRRKL